MLLPADILFVTLVLAVMGIPANILFIALVLAMTGLGTTGISLVMIGRAYTGLRRGREISGTDTSDVRNLEPGTVGVRGTARPVEGVDPPDAPISGDEALVTSVEVERVKSDSWLPFHEETVAVPFAVDDGTGRVRVEPTDGVTVNLDGDEIVVPGREDPPEAVQRYVEGTTAVDPADGYDPESAATAAVLRAIERDSGVAMVSGEARRYTESVVEPGDEVYVLGEAVERESGLGERRFAIDGETDAGLFLVGDESEGRLVWEGTINGVMVVVFYGLLALVGVVISVIAVAVALNPPS